MQSVSQANGMGASELVLGLCVCPFIGLAADHLIHTWRKAA